VLNQTTPRNDTPPGGGPAQGYFESYVWNSVARIGEFGLAYLFSVLLARMLDPEGYGSYTSIVSLATFVLVISDAGIGKALNRYLGAAAASPDSALEVPTIVRALFLSRLVLIGALTAALFFGRGLIAAWFENETIAPLIAIAVLYLVTQSLAMFAVAVLTSFLRTRIVGILTLAFRVANLVLAYVLLSRGAGVGEIMVLLGVTSLLLFLAYLSRIRTAFGGPSRPIDLPRLLMYAVNGSVLGVVSFGLGRPADVILLNAIRHSQTEVAVYDVAYALVRAVAGVLPMGMIGVALTLFSRRHRARPGSVGALWRSAVVVLGAVVVPPVVFLIANARACVLAVYGTSYAEASTLLLAFAAPMCVGWLFGGESSGTALQSTDHMRTSVRVRTAAVVTNVVVNIFLIRELGPIGALLGTGLVNSGMYVIEALAVRRVLGTRIPLGHVPGILVAMAVALAPSIFLGPEGLVQVLGHGVLFLGIYLAMLALLRPLPELDEGLVSALPGTLGRFLARLSSASRG
jgi:O-antigen/teichoic acid export membrane protein